MAGNSAPQLGVRYAFKPGRSLRARPNAARELLAVKFTEIPDKVAMGRPGTLMRQGDKVSVQLATHDGASSVLFGGTRRVQRADSAVDDYVLVFAGGKMWLERTSDYFYGVRPVDGGRGGRPPPDYPRGGEDDVGRDADSWMGGELDSGSPITPEEDAMVEGGKLGGKSTPPMTSQPARRMMVSAGKLNGKVSPGRPAAAAKSVATKSLAGKGLSKTQVPSGRRRKEDSDASSEGSSSEEDDSDDSDSDSDGDSDSGGEYTDRSSDED